MIVCPQEKDSADNYILSNAQKTDLVITKDIVFAEKLVEKDITAINDRGTIFTKENIREMISERNYSLSLAQIGLVNHYKEGYDKKKFSKFANCFDKTLHQLLRN